MVNRVHLFISYWSVGDTPIFFWGGAQVEVFEYHLIFVVNGEYNRQGRETISRTKISIGTGP